MTTPPNPRHRQSDKARLYKTYISTSAVGLEVVLSVGIGALFGLWLDNRFGRHPWGLLFGFVVGIAAAARRLVHFAKGYLRRARE
ncbi:MAG: AtpZ/AtpI family protein [Myxococcota bacterium]